MFCMINCLSSFDFLMDSQNSKHSGNKDGTSSFGTVFITFLHALFFFDFFFFHMSLVAGAEGKLNT